MPTGLCETGVASPLLRPALTVARLRRPCERFRASRRDAMAGIWKLRAEGGEGDGRRRAEVSGLMGVLFLWRFLG